MMTLMPIQASGARRRAAVSIDRQHSTRKSKGISVRSYFLGTFALLMPVLVLSQQANPFAGRWSGSIAMSRNNGQQVQLELSITQTGGTWRLIGRAKGDPCLGKDFPIVVTSQSEMELQVEVKGASVLQGCMDQAAILKTSDMKHVDGVLADGTAFQLVRQ